MRRPKLYLAGPDVFLRDAAAMGRRKTDLCGAYGFTGIYPLDTAIGGDPADPAARIYAANVASMRAADGAIVNLTPFRGPSADAGTIFELGMLIALGKEVFAYTNAADTIRDRMCRAQEARFDADTATWRDAHDMSVEDFGNGDNLMIDEAIKAAGRRVHRRDVPVERRFSELDGFVACLEEAKAAFEGRAA